MGKFCVSFRMELFQRLACIFKRANHSLLGPSFLKFLTQKHFQNTLACSSPWPVMYLYPCASEILCLTMRHFLFHLFCRIKKLNKWNKIQSKNEVFWILYKMKPGKNHDSYSLTSYIKSKLVTLKWLKPDLRFLSG